MYIVMHRDIAIRTKGTAPISSSFRIHVARSPRLEWEAIFLVRNDIDLIFYLFRFLYFAGKRGRQAIVVFEIENRPEEDKEKAHHGEITTFPFQKRQSTKHHSPIYSRSCN